MNLSRYILIWVFFLSICCVLTQAPAQCWMYQTSGTSYILHSISFADSLHGIMFGGGSTPFTTSDGGSTWIAHEPIYINAIIYDVVMTDSSTAYAVGAERSIFKSTDGCISWTLQRGNEDRSLRSVSFYDKNRGITVGDQGFIYYTTNAGYWWYRGSNVPVVDLSDVAWIDSVTAVAIGYYGHILRTTDCGQTWTLLTVMGWALNAISFCDSNVGVIAGYGKIYRTTNGGADWQVQMISDGRSFNDVSFFDDTHGLTIGSNGTILASMNGGLTWLPYQSPEINYNNLCFSQGGGSHIVGDGGTVLRSIYTCSSYELQSVTPANGVKNVPLEQDNNQRSVLLRWSFIPNILISHAGVKVSLDSSMKDNILFDTCLTTGNKITTSFSAYNLTAGTTYYWQVDLIKYDSIVEARSAVTKFTTVRGFISGMVFNDLNRNGVKELDENVMDRTLMVSGKINANVHTTDSGRFSIAGIDSGTYIISDDGYPIWKHSIPASGSYTVQIGLNETVGGMDFGCYFPWNSMSGVVFYDLNENGIRDDGEPGLTDWSAQFISPLGAESSFTNLEGYYNFSRVPIGECTVNVIVQPGWEQIYPRVGKPLAYTFYSYDNNLSSDFSIHKIPSRVKFSLTYNDNRGAPFVQLRCGTRPNTGTGIWGVDDECTSADYAEGEFEIPPLFPGGFDARFVRPPFSSSDFGYGSWTDIRPFISPSQIDTYYIRFSAGIVDGGDYPVTFRWSKELVQASYGGDVELAYLNGTTTDMKINDSIVIVDPDVYVLKLIARSPRLHFRWNLISVPMVVSDARKKILYANAISPAYAFEGVYVEKDTLSNGVGYWLKYHESETFPMSGSSLLEDTIDIAEGWNMIGSIAVPVDVTNITSIPPGMITSEFFGHTVQYVLVDTIQPGRGYWVKAGQAGRLILASNDGERSVAERIKVVTIPELPPPPPEDDNRPFSRTTLPLTIELFQNSPNPFNAVTTISYSLPYVSEVLLRIFNILGQEITRLVDGIDPAGLRVVRWDASGVASGVYLYRLEVANSHNPGRTVTQVRKMLVIK